MIAKSSSFMAESRSGKTLDILHQKPLIGDLDSGALLASKCIKGEIWSTLEDTSTKKDCSKSMFRFANVTKNQS